MPKQKDMVEKHRFDLIKSELEIPLDDIARHVEVYQGIPGEQDSTPEMKDKVSLMKLHDELAYEEGEINTDLEYLVVEDFLEKDIVSKGNVVYSLTEEAERYYTDVKEWTSEYSESLETALGK